jgi:hypothetical protein
MPPPKHKMPVMPLDKLCSREEAKMESVGLPLEGLTARLT